MRVTRHQLVICDGPRCSARGRPDALWRRAQRLRTCQPAWAQRLGIASYSCLGRCPAGPNVLIRGLSEGVPADEAPGLFDLDGSHHYWAVDEASLETILRAHCEGRGPLKGRHQRY